MSEKYNNGTCWEKETEELCPKQWDWGQALMRLAYGANWMGNDDFHLMNNTIPSEEPAPQFIVDLAKAWENGKEPGWFDAERTRGIVNGNMGSTASVD
jgi:hypothetical protein